MTAKIKNKVPVALPTKTKTGRDGDSVAGEVKASFAMKRQCRSRLTFFTIALTLSRVLML